MVELHLRITTNDFTMEQIVDFIKTLSPLKYIVAQEVVPYNHYHSHFSYECANFTDYQKRKLGKIVCEHFNLTGNKQYGISQDRGKSEVYTLKDGTYTYAGYTDDQIQELYSQSTTKLKFKEILKDLKDRYMLKQITYRNYVNDYIETHIKHEKPLATFRIEAHCRSVYLARNPHLAHIYANEIMLKTQQWEIKDHATKNDFDLDVLDD